MERSIGSTDLRQKLTDILKQVQERRDSYIIETFGRPQAAIINLEEYEQFQRFRKEREAFFEWLESTASQNAQRNKNLTEQEVLSIIEQARQEASAGAP
ncbi:MAG: type II toxin-antitoxin system prevent-host-death family antitoxin [Chloroflexi bacterium]|nr:type II toxin-antitoxin system prevent-host-death family antitoxin [Chloroflexota bacterium]